jgi:hypothetical protein
MRVEATPEEIRAGLEVVEQQARVVLTAAGWTRTEYEGVERWRDPMNGRQWSLWYALGSLRKDVGG